MQTVIDCRGGTLADALRHGPLPLALALACARDIASAISQLHRQQLVLGQLDAAAIEFGPAGASLPIPKAIYRRATPAGDVHDFGSLLHRMITGVKPDGAPPPEAPALTEETTPETIRAAALRLAVRCHDRSTGGEAPSMRQVATELRLLNLMVLRFPAAADPAVNSPGQTATAA